MLPLTVGFLTLAGLCWQQRGNLTLLPSVSPAAQTCLEEAGVMEPHQEVQVRCLQHLQVPCLSWAT